MRSKLRSMLGVVVVALALGAVASASASATELPELSLKPGEKGTLAELKFSGQNTVDKTYWEGADPEKAFKCSYDSISGTAVDSKTVTATIAFHGCQAVGTKCHSLHHKDLEEIATEELTGTLAYISKTAKTVGFVFKPKTGTLITEFDCFNSGYTPVIGSITSDIDAS